MRVCPKCGFTDSPIWRNKMALRLYVQYCHIEELDDFEPEVAKELRKEWGKSNYYFKDGIKYRINSGGYVDRIDAYLCAHPEPRNPSISEPQKEKHKAKLIPPKKNQLLLIPLPIKEKTGSVGTNRLRKKLSVGTRTQAILYNQEVAVK